MADKRTMAQLLQALIEGYMDAIVVPVITADNFEIKHGLLTLVQNKQFFGHDKEDPHAHGAARIWLEKEPPRSIFTWDDLVSEFINQFFPPFKTTKLHQDSLKSAAGGNFLDKMPRECLAIIESKSKVHYLRNKPIVAKVSTNTSTFGISPDVAELKDMVKALLLDKKSQSPAPVKAVEESCVTYGGAHSYRSCPATDGNVYRDHIQEFVSQASAVNYNQGNNSYRPPMKYNQIRPLGFPFVPNNQNDQRNTQNRFIPNQNRGNNFNQGPVYQPLIFQPPAYQASAPQTQGVSKEDFSAYFVNSNSAFIASSGTLPSNTIANPRSDLKAITTRSGVSYDGPQIPPPPSFLPKVVENKPKATKDTVNPTNNGNIEDVQPQVVSSESAVLTFKPVTSPISEPVIASVSASKPNPKSSILYPSRRNDERNREKANNQIEKFYQIFKDMSFKISFADALILMPKFTSTLKALIGNKEKLSEMARTLLNEHCSTVLLKKLPEKLGDPGNFSIPCDFPSMGECLVLPDLGASINLMPFFVWKRLSLPDLTPTCMTLELADRSISHLVGVAEDVYVKRSFLKTGIALIDVFEAVELKDQPPHLEYVFLEGDDKFSVIISKDLSVEEKTALITVLNIHKRAIAWKLSDINGIDPQFCTHKILMEEDFEPVVQHQRRVNPKIHDVIKQEVIKLLEARLIYPISDSPWVSLVHCVPKKGGFTVVENEDNELIPTRLVTGWRVCIDYRKLNEATQKDHFPLPFMDQMLERLAGNQYYCFLDSFFGYFQILIDPKDQEKTTFTGPYETFAYRHMPFGLCNAPSTFQRCVMAIFHDMIEKTMEVFMDDFSVFGNSFQSCLSHLERMLKRCEDTNLCLNWEKSHYMVKEGIVLGHKISKQGIEVDKAKVDVITKLPHLTTVKRIRSFLGHAVFYRRFIKDFLKIARPMTRLLEKDTSFIFSQECVEAF
uniref:Reverse transcriptase domain-containing protein n=1 Tax=Tanacetum cinerariifolium TaxID=118510 RepID=A0A699IVG6_TANCI|nr:reverse transcriptase domain-containing protein [Tanacetum cinerariifolium]